MWGAMWAGLQKASGRISASIGESVSVQRRGMAHGRLWMTKKGKLGFKKRVTMDVVLLEDIPGVGVQGQIISARKGYAMNYIIRNGKGELATPLNRHLYAKPVTELAVVNQTGDKVISHLKRWVKGIELTEIKIGVLKPSVNKIEVSPFTITSRLNAIKKMNIPAFAVDKIQPIKENDDKITGFSRKEHDQALADFDVLELGPVLTANKINKPGKYIVTLDLSKGLDLTERVLGRLRLSIYGHGESGTNPDKKREPKRRRSINPRKQLYRMKMGMPNHTWNGWDQIS